MIETLALVAVLGTASYRLTRLVTRDTITDGLRTAVGRWAWDQHREQWRGGFRRRTHQLITCPFCLGVWISAAVFVWADLAQLGPETGVAGDVVLVAAVAGVQGLLATRSGA